MEGIRHWGHIPVEEVLASLETSSERGLSFAQVKERLSIYGKNALVREQRVTLLSLILKQCKNPLALALFAAGLATILLGETVDTIVIFLALFINVAVGVFQEDRADRAFESLKGSDQRRAIVLREGKKMNVAESELVPGDIILLEAGYFVPADARLLSVHELMVNESMLTGEWAAVSKQTEPIERDAPPTEQRGMVFMGTLIESGRGVAAVVETGSRTQMGAIAKDLTLIHDTATPLARGIRHIARVLSALVIVILVAIFTTGLLRGEMLADMLLLAIAIAVATIPAGLPAAVTVVLALGMEAILRRGGLVRNLLAAETLGATTIILTDKTGTLTEAKMKLEDIVLFEEAEATEAARRKVLKAAILTTNAFIEEEADAPSKLTVHGNPIEKAVVLHGLEEGMSPDALFVKEPRLDVMPFESARRFAASLHGGPKESRTLYLTGAPEVLVEHARNMETRGKKKHITQGDRIALLELIARKSASGMRLIGVAKRQVKWDALPQSSEASRRDLLEELTFLGVLAFFDPIRADVPVAIAQAREAGANVIMITGDNPETARAVARLAGIVSPGSEQVLRGEEIERMNDAEICEALGSVSVIARALPSHKLKIAHALKGCGEVIAMTGDGINDAPALRAANIGVAVGSGTEVAKEASDLVLLNDSFSIIVSAIEEGRRIIDNLKKIVAYLLSTSFSEIFVIGGAFAAGAPLPLLPAQILLANIIEEGVMSFPFAFEKADEDVMRRSPRAAVAKQVLTRELMALITIVTLVTGTLLIGLFLFLHFMIALPIEEIRTVMFVALSLDAIFFSFSLKSLNTPLWRINLLSNPYLLIALGINIAILIATLTVPFMRSLLSLTPLSPFDFLLLIGVGLINLLTIETVKLLVMRPPTAK